MIAVYVSRVSKCDVVDAPKSVIDYLIDTGVDTYDREELTQLCAELEESGDDPEILNWFKALDWPPEGDDYLLLGLD